MLEARKLSVGYGGRKVLSDIDLRINEGEICALIGANGCGKSTLLRAMAGLQPISAGSVLLSEQNMAKIPRRAVARQIALMTQSPTGPDGLTVAQIVAHGLFARRGMFGRSDTMLDQHVVSEALDQTGLLSFADRPFDVLSGGERQRVWIALALAQQPRLLMLDEPTSYLDMGHQHEVLSLLRDLKDQRGIGIVMVLHDINHASWFADRIVALKDQRIVADGDPADVVTADLVLSLFGARVTVMQDRGGVHPYCMAQGRLD